MESCKQQQEFPTDPLAVALGACTVAMVRREIKEAFPHPLNQLSLAAAIYETFLREYVSEDAAMSFRLQTCMGLEEEGQGRGL